MTYNNEFTADSEFSATIKTTKREINYRNILFIILTLVMSTQVLPGNMNPFGYVMLGIASIFNMPLILIFIASLLGMAIISSGIDSYILMTIFFVVFTIFTALINVEGISRKYVSLIKMVLSITIVKIVSSIFMKASFLMGMYEIIIASILFIVFVSGIYVILNLRKGYVFSNEEMIAMLTVLAFCISGLSGIQIMNVSIMNVVSIICIMIYGWKNGSILGGMAGLIIGLVITLVNDLNVTYVIAMAFSGTIAGLFNKIGKISVIVGFTLGTIIISTFANADSYFMATILEIIISSLVLLFIPKKVSVSLDNMFSSNGKLPASYDNLLDFGTDVKNKLDAAAGVFKDLADITLPITSEDKTETREIIKKYILTHIEENCIGCNKKLDCINDESLNISIDYIASRLERLENIDSSMLNINCNDSEKLINDIKQIYDSMKITRVLKKKEEENSKTLSKQYKEVSKLISNIAKNIVNSPVKSEKSIKHIREELKMMGYQVYEDEIVVNKKYVEYTFITDILTNIDVQKKEIISAISNILEKPMNIKLLLNISKSERSKIKLVSMSKYDTETAIKQDTKKGEVQNGDSYLTMDIGKGKYISVISDGVGSSAAAEKSSRNVISMLEKLIKGGFDEDKAIEIINSIVKLRESENNFATLDILLLDLEKGMSEYIKLGAAPTYIIQNGKISTISCYNIPVGLLNNAEYIPISKKINPSDIIVQISDGVVKEDENVNDNYFTKVLSQIDTSNSSKEIVLEIEKAVLKENKNILLDDVTIIVNKISQNS